MKNKKIKITEIFSKKKEIKPMCRNCRLFDSKENVCRVIVLNEGERINIPVEKNDSCFFENEFIAINEEGKKELFKPEVQQVKFWVEDEKGEKTNGNGIVKIEYPYGFFGNEDK